jgi:hypothetical protein
MHRARDEIFREHIAVVLQDLFVRMVLSKGLIKQGNYPGWLQHDPPKY